MFDKIKALFASKEEKVDTVPQDADENWNPADYNPVVEIEAPGHKDGEV